MGVQESKHFYEQATAEADYFSMGPPPQIPLGQDEAMRARRFLRLMKKTCKQCGPVRDRFQDMELDKKTEEMVMPNEWSLKFDKKETTSHIFQTMTQMYFYSTNLTAIFRNGSPPFMSNRMIGFFGRELVVFQQNLNYIEKNLGDFSPEQFQACKLATEETKEALNDLCALLKKHPQSDRENFRTMWMLPPKIPK